MKKIFLTLLLCALPVAVLAAGYDLSTKKITSVDVMPVNETVSTDYLPVYRTATGTEVSELIPLDAVSGVETVTAANTLTAAECGKIVFISSTTGFANTLPTPTAGCEFDFVIGTDSTGTSHTIITTGAESIKGLGFESETDTGDDGPTTAGADTITFVSSAANAADTVQLKSDGTWWYAISFTSADGGVTFTSAI